MASKVRDMMVTLQVTVERCTEPFSYPYEISTVYEVGVTTEERSRVRRGDTWWTDRYVGHVAYSPETREWLARDGHGRLWGSSAKTRMEAVQALLTPWGRYWAADTKSSKAALMRAAKEA